MTDDKDERIEALEAANELLRAEVAASAVKRREWLRRHRRHERGAEKALHRKKVRNRRRNKEARASRRQQRK